MFSTATLKRRVGVLSWAAAAVFALWLVTSAAQARNEHRKTLPPQLDIVLELTGAMKGQSFPHIKVTLRNISRHALNVWKWTCPAGLAALSFEIVLHDGTVIKQHRVPSAMDLEFENSLALKPGDQYVTSIMLDPGERAGIIKPSDIASVRAVYKVPSGSLTRLHNVWSGQIVSPDQIVVVP